MSGYPPNLANSPKSLAEARRRARDGGDSLLYPPTKSPSSGLSISPVLLFSPFPVFTVLLFYPLSAVMPFYHSRRILRIFHICVSLLPLPPECESYQQIPFPRRFNSANLLCFRFYNLDLLLPLLPFCQL